MVRVFFDLGVIIFMVCIITFSALALAIVHNRTYNYDEPNDTL